MALREITHNGYLHWQCYGCVEGEHCLTQLSAHISEVAYRSKQGRVRGAMIDLPICHVCGTQRSLKADYTFKELFLATLTHTDECGGILAYFLKMPHVYNLLVHDWLYQQGRAEHAPALALPTREELTDPRLAAIPGNVALALWFGYKIVQHYDRRLESIDMVLREIAVLPAGEERKLIDGPPCN